MVKRGVSSLHEMLNDLMALARLEAGQEQRAVAPFDAGVLLSDFCTTSIPQADAQGLYLKLEGPESLPVYGDRAKVRRILQNLLLNALKYTRRGGVRVIWGPVAGDETNNWMFCVQDTGPGLVKGPAAPLAQALHEATVTTQEGQERRGETDDHAGPAPTLASQSSPLAPHQQPGEGVGLSIVKRLCELLDASLELETSPGEGSTFRVTLPCRYEEPPAHSEKPLP
jgi:signal transduction histidine kinase